MADYWVSQQRHWCKYCKKYVANNKPSIALHENGRSHKDEVERFLRGVYTKGRKDIEDAESVKLELQRIERAALQSMDPKDRYKYASSTPPAPITPSKRTQSYYVDPTVPTIEELREQAEAEKQQAVEGREEWAVNKEIAKVGEWETVAVQAPPPAASENTYKGKNNESGSAHDQAPEFQDDDEDQEDLHSFKIKEKELDVPILDHKEGEEVTFKKRKLADSGMKSRKKKPLRKKE